jgi:transcriptional regulator with XRE-family HTH domain
MAKSYTSPELLKAARLASGESQADVARAVGITRNAISQYEKGLRRPTDEIKVRLSKHFNTTVSFLFYGGR